MSDSHQQTPSPPLTPQQRYDAALAALPARQRRFVVAYLACLNASQAARQADYSDKTAGQIGYQLLQKTSIAAAVAAGLDLQAMPSAEILARMAAIARGTVADVLSLPEPESDQLAGRWSLDLVKAQQTGAIHLVKRIKEGEHGPEVELYSAYDALVKLGEHQKLWGKGADLMKIIDLSKLSDQQLELLASGEDPLKVLLG